MQELAEEIERQKALAIKNRARPNRILLTCAMVGFFLSVFVLVAFNTAVEKTLFSGIVISSLTGVALSLTTPRHLARCPKCNLDWEMTARSAQNLLTWKSCPGCGLETTMNPPQGDQAELLSCSRCSEVVARKEARTLWRLPLLVLTVAAMKPENEGNELYCKKCIGTLNASVCLLALMGAFAVALNLWLHSFYVLGMSAGCLLTWLVVRRRRERNMKSKGRSAEQSKGSREQRLH